MVALALLLPCHRYFTRRSALLTGPASPGWMLAVGFVLLSMAWIGWFSYREVAFTGEAWWQFAFRADAPRFLRGLGGASTVVLLAGLVRLLRSAPRATGEPPTPGALDRARAIIARNGVPQGCLSLLGDKWLLFADGEQPGGPDDGFIMYAPQEASWVAMGGPIGPEATREALVWDFRAAAEAAGARPVLYEVAEDDLPLMLDVGLALYKLGEEARVSMSGFSGWKPRCRNSSAAVSPFNTP
jgi:phosphatidylglycerol lysyltransferase